MKQKIFFIVLIPGLILLFESSLSGSIQNNNYGAYLTISFQNPAMFKDSTSQKTLKSNIERVFENEGIHLIHIEKPEEYKLNITVTIKDSLIIEAKGTGTNGTSISIVKKPRIVYSYKNEKKIYNSIRDYIKKYL